MRYKRYRGDYQVQVDENKKRTFKYTGQYHELTASDEEISAYIKANLATVIVLVAMHLVMAFLNTDGSRSFYVLFPYLFSFMSVLFMISGMFRVLYRRERRLLELYDYEKGYSRIYHSISGCMVISGIIVIADIVFIICEFHDIKVWKECVFAVIAIINGILSFYVMKYDKEMDKKICLMKKKKKTDEEDEEDESV